MQWLIITANVVVFRITISGHRVPASSHTSKLDRHKSVCILCWPEFVWYDGVSQVLCFGAIGMAGTTLTSGDLDGHF